jgi:hypothetical protein
MVPGSGGEAEHAIERLDELADRIVEAMMRRAEQDSGMTVDEVQQLLVLRVREEAARANVRPRHLMGAVWRSWERHNRPPMLGEGEAYRIVDSLVDKGILQREERPGEAPIIRWGGLSLAEVEARMGGLTHDEQLFVRGVLRYLERYGGPPL